MQRFRFGLGGLGGPLTERELYGDAPLAERMQTYARRFDAYEMNVTARPDFTAQDAHALVDRCPSNVHMIARMHRDMTGAQDLDPMALDRWFDAVDPILRCSHRGPLYLPWSGERTSTSQERLEALLAALWPRLPARQRVAVEFQHPSWFHPDPIHMIEESGAGLVWSTVAGKVPYRVTAEFLYIRLTGAKHRTVDEVSAFVERLRARPQDQRPVYVLSALHADPYGLHALARFAHLVGQPLQTVPPLLPAGQPTLDAFVGA